MDIQSDNPRKIVIALCALTVAWSVSPIMSACAEFMRYLHTHLAAATISDGLRNVLDLISAVALPLLRTAIYLFVAFLMFRTIREWRPANSSALSVFDPRVVTSTGWLLIATGVPIVAQEALFLVAMSNTRAANHISGLVEPFHGYVYGTVLCTALGLALTTAIGCLLVIEGRRARSRMLDNGAPPV